jgi:hypothetical protein
MASGGLTINLEPSVSAEFLLSHRTQRVKASHFGASCIALTCIFLTQIIGTFLFI